MKVVVPSFTSGGENVTELPAMVIPITKQRLNNCLVAFIFVAVFNSLMFMVALAQAIQPLSLFMVWIFILYNLQLH